MLAILVPFAVSDLSACFHDHVFCTDASLEKGAICSARVPLRIARHLWSGLRSKGAFHRLLPPAEALAKRIGMHEEVPEEPPVRAARPLAFHYEFIEIFSGAAVATAAAASLGMVVGPPIDLSCSPEFNMEWVHVISWLSFLVSSRRVLAFMVSPPCTSFSLMRRPALRSRLCPFGFDPAHLQTKVGNLLAHRGLQLLRVGLVNGVAGLFETPFGALLRHLPGFRAFLGKPCVQQTRCDSCMYGSIHLKSFRFLAVHMSLEKLCRRCDRMHSHVVIQGQYTKDSATYVPGLAQALALSFREAVDLIHKTSRGEDDTKVRGHETQLANSVALSAKWQVDSVWSFKRPSHINILEMSALGRLADRLARTGKSMRVTALMDSFVCSAASSKGRTSSLGLAPPLRRFCATSVAAFLFFCTPFVPTRLNASDDPTRSVEIRSPSGSYSFSDWTDDEIFDLLCLPRLRRWTSNWVRLVLSLCGPSLLRLSRRNLFRQVHPSLSPSPQDSLPSLHDAMGFQGLDFDSSLGYPGEGPRLLTFQPRFRLPWVVVPLVASCSFCGLPVLSSPCLLLLSLSSQCSVLGSFAFAAAMASELPKVSGVILPRNAADNLRAETRFGRPELQLGRPVLPSTTLNREALYNTFVSWCRQTGVDFNGLLCHAMQNLDEINAILTKYGRELYSAGRPYGHFAETINSVASRRPAIRRHLQQSWDLAYAWVKQEPPAHHTAMPFQVLLACLATALMWGWVRFSGILALTWGGVMRIGEALKARRRDLLLPSDFASSYPIALLAIDEAKTRFSAARHQTAKLDIPDLVKVVSIAFRELPLESFLWPFSGSTLRLRFRAVMKALRLPVQATSIVRPLDLGSLRSGGATWILSVTEDGELVRRRGRWLTQRIMEIYLQETSAIRYIQMLSSEQREVVLTMAHSFLPVLQRCELYVASSIPSTIWYRLFCNF